MPAVKLAGFNLKPRLLLILLNFWIFVKETYFFSLKVVIMGKSSYGCVLEASGGPSKRDIRSKIESESVNCSSLLMVFLLGFYVRERSGNSQDSAQIPVSMAQSPQSQSSKPH